MPVAAAAAALVLAQPTPASAALVVDKDAESFVVSIDDGTAVADAMRELGEAFDFTVTVRGDPGSLGPLHFRSKTVAEAVRRIARGQQLVIRHVIGKGGLSTVSDVVVVAHSADASEPPAGQMQQAAATPPPAQPPPPPKTNGRAPDRKVLDRLVEVAAMADKPAAQAIPALTQVVKSDPKSEARAAAVRALARLGEEASWKGIDAALNDTAPAVRLAAIRAEDPSRDGFPSTRINDMAQGDPDTAVRAAAKSLLDNGGSDDGGQGDNGDDNGDNPPPDNSGDDNSGG
jgi:hypothetical protein